MKNLNFGTGLLIILSVVVISFIAAKIYEVETRTMADTMRKQASLRCQLELIDRINISAKYGSFEITASETPTPDQIKYLTNQKFTLEYLTLPDPNDLSKLDTLSTTIKW